MVDGKERLKLTEHTKTTTQNPVAQIQYIYETPEILRSICSTGSCLQYGNGVSTSNSPPARNIVMTYLDYYYHY